MDVRFLVTVLHFYSALKFLFPFRRNTVRKNLFLSVCHCLDPKISMREMNILYPHGGLIGYGNSNLDTLLRFSKVSICNSTRCSWCCLCREWKRAGILLCDWTWTQFMFFGSHNGTLLLFVFEDICPLYFQSV